MPKNIDIPFSDLIQKAQMLFWVNGFKAVTPEHLAKELNVSVSTIYNKYGKDYLFVEALNRYVSSFSDPTLQAMRESDKGLETFREVFYQLIDALLDGGFPKSCLMVNTIVEVKDDLYELNELYDSYFKNIRKSYTQVLERAYRQKEIKHAESIPDYTEFLLGVIFGLSVLYKVKTRAELRAYVDEQLSLIK
jgi:TetR/AcrR family transcriptional repressor of nem operon